MRCRCSSACAALVRRSARPSDTPSDAKLKRVFVPVYAGVGLLLAAISSLGSTVLTTNDVAYVGAVACAALLLLGGLAPVLPRWVAERVVAALVVPVVMNDWCNAGLLRQGRMWPLLVLLLDSLLVAGLYELARWSSDPSDIVNAGVCACARPPCGRPAADILHAVLEWFAM
eukprot:gene6645-8978_t